MEDKYQKEFVEWYRKFIEENPCLESGNPYVPVAQMAFEAGLQCGFKHCPDHARQIVADLLCLLVDLDAKDKLIFDDEKKKIEAAEEFLK